MKKYQKGGMPQGINKSAVMPGRASIKTLPWPKNLKEVVLALCVSLPPRPQEAVRLLPWPRLQEGVLAERAVAPLSDPEDGYDDSTLLG